MLKRITWIYVAAQVACSRPPPTPPPEAGKATAGLERVRFEPQTEEVSNYTCGQQLDTCTAALAGDSLPGLCNKIFGPEAPPSVLPEIARDDVAMCLAGKAAQYWGFATTGDSNLCGQQMCLDLFVMCMAKNAYEPIRRMLLPQDADDIAALEAVLAADPHFVNLDKFNIVPSPPPPPIPDREDLEQQIVTARDGFRRAIHHFVDRLTTDAHLDCMLEEHVGEAAAARAGSASTLWSYLSEAIDLYIELSMDHLHYLRVAAEDRTIEDLARPGHAAEPMGILCRSAEVWNEILRTLYGKPQYSADPSQQPGFEGEDDNFWPVSNGGTLDDCNGGGTWPVRRGWVAPRTSIRGAAVHHALYGESGTADPAGDSLIERLGRAIDVGSQVPSGAPYLQGKDWLAEQLYSDLAAHIDGDGVVADWFDETALARIVPDPGDNFAELAGRLGVSAEDVANGVLYSATNALLHASPATGVMDAMAPAAYATVSAAPYMDVDHFVTLAHGPTSFAVADVDAEPAPIEDVWGNPTGAEWYYIHSPGFQFAPDYGLWGNLSVWKWRLEQAKGTHDAAGGIDNVEPFELAVDVRKHLGTLLGEDLVRFHTWEYAGTDQIHHIAAPYFEVQLAESAPDCASLLARVELWEKTLGVECAQNSSRPVACDGALFTYEANGDINAPQGTQVGSYSCGPDNKTIRLGIYPAGLTRLDGQNVAINVDGQTVAIRHLDWNCSNEEPLATCSAMAHPDYEHDFPYYFGGTLDDLVSRVFGVSGLSANRSLYTPVDVEADIVPPLENDILGDQDDFDDAYQTYLDLAEAVALDIYGLITTVRDDAEISTLVRTRVARELENLAEDAKDQVEDLCGAGGEQCSFEPVDLTLSDVPGFLLKYDPLIDFNPRTLTLGDYCAVMATQFEHGLVPPNRLCWDTCVDSETDDYVRDTGDDCGSLGDHTEVEATAYVMGFTIHELVHANPDAPAECPGQAACQLDRDPGALGADHCGCLTFRTSERRLADWWTWLYAHDGEWDDTVLGCDGCDADYPQLERLPMLHWELEHLNWVGPASDLPADRCVEPGEVVYLDHGPPNNPGGNHTHTRPTQEEFEDLMGQMARDPEALLSVLAELDCRFRDMYASLGEITLRNVPSEFDDGILDDVERAQYGGGYLLAMINVNAAFKSIQDTALGFVNAFNSFGDGMARAALDIEHAKDLDKLAAEMSTSLKGFFNGNWGSNISGWLGPDEGASLNLQARILEAGGGQTLATNMANFSLQLGSFHATLNSAWASLDAALEGLEGLERARGHIVAKADRDRTLARLQGLVEDPTARSLFNRRYERIKWLTPRALKLGYIARRAVEFRLGVDLGEEKTKGLFDEPAVLWRNDVFRNDRYSIMAGYDPENPDVAEEATVKFVRRLREYVLGYSFVYPFTSSDDTAVLSMKDDVVAAGTCSRPAWNYLRQSGDLNLSDPEPDYWTYESDTMTPCAACVTRDDAADRRDSDGDGVHDEGVYLPVEADGTEGILTMAGGGSRRFEQIYSDAAVVPMDLVLGVWARALGNGSLRLGFVDAAGVKLPGVGSVDVALTRVCPEGDGWRRYELPVQCSAACAGVYLEWEGGGDVEIWGLQLRPSSYTFAYAETLGGVAIAPVPDALEDAPNCAVDVEDAIADVALNGAACNGTVNDGLVLRPTYDHGGAGLRSSFQAKCVDDEAAVRRVRAEDCDGRGGIEFYELSFPMSVDTLARFPNADDNYNYRHDWIAVNLVGSNVHDCSDVSEDIASCYANLFIPYTLVQSGDTVVTNHDFEEMLFSPKPAKIATGRGLAAERTITSPLSSLDLAAIEQYRHANFRGRPIFGRYDLRLYNVPGFHFERIQDIQMVVGYRYWTPSGI